VKLIVLPADEAATLVVGVVSVPDPSAASGASASVWPMLTAFEDAKSPVEGVNGVPAAGPAALPAADVEREPAVPPVEDWSHSSPVTPVQFEPTVPPLRAP
jgi:hypothetical protein